MPGQGPLLQKASPSLPRALSSFPKPCIEVQSPRTRLVRAAADGKSLGRAVRGCVRTDMALRPFLFCGRRCVPVMPALPGQSLSPCPYTRFRKVDGGCGGKAESPFDEKGFRLPPACVWATGGCSRGAGGVRRVRGGLSGAAGFVRGCRGSRTGFGAGAVWPGWGCAGCPGTGLRSRR